MPRFTPLASSTFTGGNETPISEGGVWTSPTSGEGSQVNRTSNAAAFVTATDSSAAYTGRTFPDDQYSRAALTCTGTAGGTSGVGLKVRQDPGARTYYRFVVDHAAANNACIIRMIAGSSTTLAQWTQPFTDGNVFALGIKGFKLYLYDKTEWLARIFDDTGGGGPASGAPGIAYSSTETSASADNWDAGAFDPDASDTYSQPGPAPECQDGDFPAEILDIRAWF